MENTQPKTEAQGAEVSIENLFNGYHKEVIESYPSIFSKDDVIHLINRIQSDVVKAQRNSEKSSSIEESFIDEIKDAVTDVIDDYDFDNDAEFDLSRGREISLSSVNTDDLCYLIRDSIDDLVREKKNS